MKHTMHNTSPLSAKLLGYGGLIPFVVSSTCQVFHLLPDLPWNTMALSYGAIILSFLGGLHWAFAMTLQELSPAQKNDRFFWSVIPSLISWSSLALPYQYATALLIFGFIAQFIQDIYIKKLASLPAWYLPLRIQLSIVACLSLLINSLLVHQLI
jgi:hypothetical protein